MKASVDINQVIGRSCVTFDMTRNYQGVDLSVTQPSFYRNIGRRNMCSREMRFFYKVT
jgi:hypothetical protein